MISTFYVKQLTPLLPLALLLSFLSLACSDVQEVINVPAKAGVHGAAYTISSSPEFHGRQIAGKGNWLLDDCQGCHAKDFSGGMTKSSCRTSGCHAGSKGPAACNTCHGVFADSTNIAPPRGLHGEIFSSSPAVGAHQKHLTGGSNGRKLDCNYCHTVPMFLNSSGHIDADNRAELLFDSVSVTVTDTIHPKPTYNRANFTCSNTYCHGNFKNGNPANTPVWTAGSAGAACGSCHGRGENPLPRGTHPPVQNCQFCHSSVVKVTITPTDTVYGFTDLNKHVNGKVDY